MELSSGVRLLLLTAKVKRLDFDKTTALKQMCFFFLFFFSCIKRVYSSEGPALIEANLIGKHRSSNQLIIRPNERVH